MLANHLLKPAFLKYFHKSTSVVCVTAHSPTKAAITCWCLVQIDHVISIRFIWVLAIWWTFHGRPCGFGDNGSASMNLLPTFFHRYTWP